MKVSESPILAWLQASASDWPAERARALRTLLLGEPALSRRLRKSRMVARRVVDMLSDVSAPVRFAAAVVLGRVRYARSLPGLQALIATDADWHIRSVAAAAIGHQGGRTALSAMRLALAHENDAQALPAYALALGETGEQDAVVDLVALAVLQDWRVRWCVARALARLGEAAAVRLLDDVIGDPGVPAEARPELAESRASVRRLIRRRLRGNG
ncbi:MAG: HEAT repeat domain-containing protein [Fimbriimonadaceae bacterium]|nr:HEAT repeat domain-containing protein [Fimbriimonadaceae bacterium]